MNAVLEPITTRVIEAPRYLNAHVNDFRRWYVSNEPLLSRYWDELGRASPDGDASDFFMFVVVQHERELEASQGAPV